MPQDRRSFFGGLHARIIMGSDEAARLRLSARRYAQGLFSLFGRTRSPKAHAFPPVIILDENNPGCFESSADRCFIGERYWDLPVNDLCSADRRHAYL
jgi:hypothetical protein